MPENPWLDNQAPRQAPGPYTPIRPRPTKVEAPVKRWTLLSENTQTFTLVALAVGGTPGAQQQRTINSDLVRPTLLGHEEALRGKAEGAISADEPICVFHFQPENEASALAGLGVIMTINTYPVLGGTANRTGGSVDISSAVLAGSGKLQIPLDTSGICSVTLALTNYANLVQPYRVITQLFANVSMSEEGAGVSKADWSST